MLAVGTALGSGDGALEATKAFMTTSTVFGGLYFDESTLPWALQWVPRTSVVRLSWDGMMAYEMGGVSTAEGELLLMAAVLFVVAFVGLWLRSPKFERLDGKAPIPSKGKAD